LLEDVVELVAGNVSIFVDVVDLKGEFELLVLFALDAEVGKSFDELDKDNNGEIDFNEFIEGLSHFSVKSEKDEKLKFAFQIYDIDKDGYISSNELYHVLKQMVGNNLKEAQLQQIVDKTMIYADSDGDGKISYDEFTKILLPYVKNDLYRRMVIDF
jgi:serine/threonine-protein phosphatase 2B regulatory subunit